jgi:hypothetical protein
MSNAFAVYLLGLFFDLECGSDTLTPKRRVVSEVQAL